MTQIGGSDNTIPDGDNYLLPLKQIKKKATKPKRKRRNIQVGGRLKAYRRNHKGSKAHAKRKGKKRTKRTIKHRKRYMRPV